MSGVEGETGEKTIDERKERILFLLFFCACLCLIQKIHQNEFFFVFILLLIFVFSIFAFLIIILDLFFEITLRNFTLVVTFSL